MISYVGGRAPVTQGADESMKRVAHRVAQTGETVVERVPRQVVDATVS